MLSFAKVRSAVGAAHYYASDNYYTAEAQTAASEWAGKGAERLGLFGPVSPEDFAKILAGELPNGAKIAAAAKGHVPGVDFTFSAPKSVSLMALVAGDQRLLDAQREAVKATLAWAESRFAEARLGKDGKVTVVTGNLVAALFQHDTSREHDPQVHTHAIVANVTQRPDGSWRALKNRELVLQNKLVGAVYHSELRSRVAALGYEIAGGGKNGMFEVAGFSRETIDAWSRRSQQIKAISERLGIVSPQGRGEIAVRSRADKTPLDAPALRELWRDMAAARGAHFAARIAQPTPPRQQPERGLLGKARAWGEQLLDRVMAFWRPKPEPLLTGQAEARQSSVVSAVYAVAAAVRHLGERSATFTRSEVLREGLNFAEGRTDIYAVERRLAALVKTGALQQGRGQHTERLTTPDMIRTEREMLAFARSGLGVLDGGPEQSTANQRIQTGAKAALGFELSDQQLSAARAVLYGPERVALIQGDAGTGKSTIFAAINAVPQSRRSGLLMLTTQSGLARKLEAESGIATQTVSRFLTRNEHLLRPNGRFHSGEPEDHAGKTLIIDEASMLSTRQMLGLFRIADKLDIARIALVGDTEQIKAIEAGRPFAQLVELFSHHRLSENRRQLDPAMRDVVALLNAGDVRAAFAAMGERLVEKREPAEAAARHWLGLASEQRDHTEILTSGHRLRGQALAALRSEQDSNLPSIELDVWKNLNLTREELSRARNWAPGMQLDLYRHEPRLGLEKGAYRVIAVSEREGRVTVERGGKRSDIHPSLLHHKGQGASLSEPRRIEVREGDRLMVTGRIDAHGVVNGDRFILAAITGDTLMLEGQEGRRIALKAGDAMRERLDAAAALNMHRVQGQTFQHTIAAMSSEDTRLNARDLAYVLASRSREGFTLYVDNAEKVMAQVERNSGRTPHALDLLSENGRYVPPSSGIFAPASIDELRSDPRGAELIKRPEPVQAPIQDRERQLDRSKGLEL